MIPAERIIVNLEDGRRYRKAGYCHVVIRIIRDVHGIFGDRDIHGTLGGICKDRPSVIERRMLQSDQRPVLTHIISRTVFYNDLL